MLHPSQLPSRREVGRRARLCHRIVTYWSLKYRGRLWRMLLSRLDMFPSRPAALGYRDITIAP